jgi:pimeloyl-ACP methyl ester carboxylesterase
MSKYLKWLALIPALLILMWIAGPRPFKPALDPHLPQVNADLISLENEVIESEKQIPYLKEDNEARIVWYDSLNKTKTKYSIVYLHGFGASQAEGSPVHTQLARQFGCNLYLARLHEHGTESPEAFASLTPDNLLASAKRAVAIGQELGEHVIVVGTSTGGALALYMAAHNPEIKALVLYSPLIDYYTNVKARAFTIPWSQEILATLNGSEYIDIPRPEGPLKQYWSERYHINGYLALDNFVRATMTRKTFEQVKCPVFLGYYYNNEELQDKTVSVEAMLTMFEQLGTDPEKKEKMAFPESGNHVIASKIRSDDWKGVEAATADFLEKTVGIQPKHRSRQALVMMY